MLPLPLPRAAGRRRTPDSIYDHADSANVVFLLVSSYPHRVDGNNSANQQKCILQR